MPVKFIVNKNLKREVSLREERITGFNAQFEIHVGRFCFSTPWYSFKTEAEADKRGEELLAEVSGFTGKPKAKKRTATKKKVANKRTATKKE